MIEREDIARLIAEWRDAELITTEQAVRISAFEQQRGPASRDEHPRDRMQAIVGTVGVVLIGLGVILTVATMWSNIAAAAKVGLLMGALCLSYLVAIVSHRRGAAGWITTSALVTATIVFSGAVFLIGSAYHVHVHAPLGLMLIAATTSALAFAVSSVPVAWLAALGICGWALHEIVQSVDASGGAHQASRVIGIAIIAAVGAHAIGWALDGRWWRGRVLAAPLRFTSMASFTTLVTIASFAWHAKPHAGVVGRIEIVAVLASAIAIGVMHRCSTRVHRNRAAVIFAATLAVAFALLAWPNPIAISFVANAVLIGGGFAMILTGLAEQRRGWYGWGIAWLITGIVARYFDFMFAADLGGIGFVGAGFLLIAIAMLIGRSRRIWNARDKEQIT